MVAGLESRLAQDPRDADGWIMLARSRTVLGDEAAARAALAKAREVFAGSADVLPRLDAAARELGLD
jgi:cytochrome c-type biogenesis protein CcmH